MTGQGHAHRSAAGLARADIEAALMDGALNLAALQKAFAHSGKSVGAKIRSGMHLTLHAIERHLFTLQLNAHHIAFAQVRLRHDIHPFVGAALVRSAVV
jgi:hypothetical protein